MKILLLIPLALAVSAAYAQTPHELDLAWDPPSNSPTPAAGYRVYFDNDPPTPASANVDVGPALSFTFPDPRLPAPQADTYYLGVEAYSQTDLRSDISPIRIIVEFGPPGAPENVRVDDLRSTAGATPDPIPTFRTGQ